MSEVSNGSSGELTRRNFLRSVATVATAPSSTARVVEKLLNGAAIPSSVVSVVEQVSLDVGAVICPPAYKNELVRRGLEMDYGSWFTGSEPIDNAMREQLNIRYAKRSDDYHFAYVAIERMPAGNIKDEYSRAFESGAIEPDEMNLLIQEGRMQCAYKSEGQYSGEQDLTDASDIFLQNLGDANAHEILYRSRLPRADIVRKWATLPRRKPVPGDFVREKLATIDRTSQAEGSPSVAASFRGQDLYTHSYSQTFLETLEDENVINAVRSILPVVDDKRWEFAPELQLAHATERQIDQLAAMLADPASILHRTYVKYFRVLLQDDLSCWLSDVEAHAQNQAEKPKSKEHVQQTQEDLAQLIAALAAPARIILGQIQQIIQRGENEK